MVDDYPDYEGGKQKVYLVPEWAALKAVDKNIYGSVDVDSDTDTYVCFFTVTSGKTFYLVQFGVMIEANTGIVFYLQDIVDLTVTYRAVSGGTPGNAHSFSKPIVFSAGHTVLLNVRHYAGTTKVCKGFFMGYEI